MNNYEEKKKELIQQEAERVKALQRREKPFKFELKHKVEDEITGLVGKITARTQFLTGENRYMVETIDSTGRPVEWWIDESRLSDN